MLLRPGEHLQSPGTGPFFGEKSHFQGEQSSENMDLSPSRQDFAVPLGIGRTESSIFLINGSTSSLSCSDTRPRTSPRVSARSAHTANRRGQTLWHRGSEWQSPVQRNH